MEISGRGFAQQQNSSTGSNNARSARESKLTGSRTTNGTTRDVTVRGRRSLSSTTQSHNSMSDLHLEKMSIASHRSQRLSRSTQEFEAKHSETSGNLSAQQQTYESRSKLPEKHRIRNQTGESSSLTDPRKCCTPRKPVRMKRAKKWCPKVEENFRLQGAGWKDIYDYAEAYGEPERWSTTGHPRCVRVKVNGYFMYWAEQPECESKYINKVKLYEYAETA